jgi:glycosyltransferase involved in cell wall biosynthesis
MRQKHGLDLKDRVILSVGALIARKGHHMIVRAMHRLMEKGFTARLLIVGGPGREGHYEADIRRLVHELGMEKQVVFVGQVPPQTVAELMSAADTLCLASDREGWPNVVHECLACGTPVLAKDVGGVPEMIPSEAYGLVIPASDPTALENGLQRMFDKDWDSRIIAAWGAARSWDQVAREILSEMEDWCRLRPGRASLETVGVSAATEAKPD